MAIFGSRRRAEDLEAELARAQAMIGELGGLDELERARQRQAAEQRLAQTLSEERAAQQRIWQANAELSALQSEVVETRVEVLLQEAGVYSYAHPLADAVAYKDRLARLRTDIKEAVRNRKAVAGSVSWTVNGSRKEGAKMVKDFSTLMLRAYNAESDNCVRTVRPHTLASTRTRLEKTRAAIAKLGATMSIAISSSYHQLRIREIELTADYLAKVEAERELIRAQKEQAREEERARKEFERQKEKLLKEQAHYRSAYDRLIAQAAPDQAAIAELRGHLDRLRVDIATVEERAANTRAGYVYVISNIGSFGDQVVKIGMTRRLEPMDRVRELGDASVPFRFDVHALVFSDDAVGLEGKLHAALADARVNRVNAHREFFRTTPHHVRDLLTAAAGGHLLEFTEEAIAPEWRASGARLTAAPVPPEQVSRPLPPEDDGPDAVAIDDQRAAALPVLRVGQLVPLTSVRQLRLALDSSDDEIDPIAFLLAADGEVRTDADMIFYGQPDHVSGAVSLAADDTGATTALHIVPTALPDDVVEVLLIAQMPPGGSTCVAVSLLDTATGKPIGRIDVPAPGPTGLLQLGGLRKDTEGWQLQVQPGALDIDLAALATAAGVHVDP